MDKIETLGYTGGDMDILLYTIWYNDKVSPHLSVEEKRQLLARISALSLRVPIQELNVRVNGADFPELVKYSMRPLSGRQLLAVMKRVFFELYGRPGTPQKG